MKSLLKIIPVLLVCSFASALIVIPSSMIMVGRMVECTMSFGCDGTSASIFDWLALLGQLAPFVIFPLGARALSRELCLLGLSEPRRRIIVGIFAALPLLLLLGLIIFQRISTATTPYQPHEGANTHYPQNGPTKATPYQPHEGVNTQYHQNGQVHLVFSYHNGQVDGEFTGFCQNGDMEYHAFFKHGKPVGQSERQACHQDEKTVELFSEQSERIYSASYKDGVLREEIKGTAPDQARSVYNEEGILETKLVGNTIVYQRSVTPTQTR